MIVSNDESKKPITCNIETQYKAHFVGRIVEEKIQISSYLDKISDDKTDITHQKPIEKKNLGIKIDIAFDKSTSESYYDVSLNVKHSNIDETGKLEADQHIKNSDFNELMTYYLADLSDDNLLKDENVINNYVKRATEMSCSCNNLLLARASYAANAITIDILNNKVRSITEKYKTK